MKIGPAGIALIQSYEKCVLHAYMPTAHDVPTLGWGHTKGVAMGDTCTQEEADAWLAEDCAEAENCINGLVNVPLTQNEFDALVAWVFNLGCGTFKKSSVLKYLNESNSDMAAERMKLYNKAGGHELAGLTRRRAAEVALFESAIA